MITLVVAAPDGPAEWLTAIGTLALAAATVAAIILTARIARTDRLRDDARRHQDREREDQLRREADDRWERRNREERRQREDDDAQQNVIVEFAPGGPLSQAERAVTTGDGITHRIIVTTTTAYPIKWVDARIAHWSNGGISIVGAGWAFDRPVTANGQVRYTCNAAVGPQLVDPAPIVRFTDRNGNQFYSYIGYTRRFGQGTEFSEAANEIDHWNRTGPRPDEPA